MKTTTDNKVIDVDENQYNKNSCDNCNYIFPLCMIENTDLCYKRVSEVMKNVFED